MGVTNLVEGKTQSFGPFAGKRPIQLNSRVRISSGTPTLRSLFGVFGGSYRPLYQERSILIPSPDTSPHQMANASDSRMPANMTRSKHSRSRSPRRSQAAAYWSRVTLSFGPEDFASFTGAFSPSVTLMGR